MTKFEQFMLYWFNLIGIGVLALGSIGLVIIFLQVYEVIFQ